MTTLEIPAPADIADSAHWGEEPPIPLEELEFDMLAFELWHLGSYPDVAELEDWTDEPQTVADRASCL